MSQIVKLFLLALVLVSPWARAGEPELVIHRLTPTPLFPNQQPLRQVANMEVTNFTSSPLDVQLALQVDGVPAEVQDVSVEPGNSMVRLLVPEIDHASQLTLEATAKEGGRTLASYSQQWQPQRKWKVFIVRSSHEDIGYEGYIFDKQHEIANFIDLGRHLSGPADSIGSYHYLLETLLFQNYYQAERSEAAWRQIVEDDLKTGRMELDGAPNGLHSQWLDYEPLARMTYPARRWTRDRFGLDLKTFLLVDNPSMSWSGAQVLADAGFRYLVRFGQPWRTGGHNDYATTQLPALFWWQGPDGHSRILYAWRSHYGLSFWYGQPDGGGGVDELLPLAEQNVTRELQAIESGQSLGPYPYDAVLVPSYSDHEVPHFDGRALRNWQKQYRYPEIRVSGPEAFMSYIEQNDGDKLPTLSGELNNFSADYATIDPMGQGRVRRAARLLPLAEGLAAVVSSMDPGFSSLGSVEKRAYEHMFNYVEHSWPTSPRINPYHVFNSQWKTQESQRALSGAEQAYHASFEALCKKIATQGDSIVVFNPLAHARSDLVEVDLPPSQSMPGGLVDAVTGQRMLFQVSGENQLSFIVHDVPAFGYKTFRITSSVADGATHAESAHEGAGDLAAGEDEISNQFYRIRFDRQTGNVISIYDKELDKELVDASGQQFNQLLRYTTSERESDDGVTQTARNVLSCESVAGPVQAAYSVLIDDATGTGAMIRQTVILYRGLKRIDVVNDLKHVAIMHSEDHRVRYKENIYYAFPYLMDRFQARVEYPGGVVRPYDDQLRWGSHDYLCANRWVDLNDGSFGITMAPWNAAIVNFGEIRYNKFAIDYKPTQPRLYSHALSNRMAGLLTNSPKECNATLRYSFTSYAGPWSSGEASDFGWSIASPLEAEVIAGGQTGELPESDSFLAVDAPNVQLVTLKHSEHPGRGWVFRLVETSGKSCRVTVQLPTFPITGAVRTDLVENDQELLPVTNRSVSLQMGPYSFATVRVFADEPQPDAVDGIRAESVTDQGLILHWDKVGPNVAAYDVYRSEDPDAPPTADTLIGRTTDDHYRDEGLKLATNYSYYVAGVTSANTQGACSPRFDVQTATQNVSPPGVVREPGVVHQALDRIDLYWLRNSEPDLARYQVYRADGEVVDPQRAQLVGTVKQTDRFLQVFRDEHVSPGASYVYWVYPEDWAGNVQRTSPAVRVQMAEP